MSYADIDIDFLLSNSSENGTCAGDKLEGGATVALGVFLAAASLFAYLPQVRASCDALR